LSNDARQEMHVSRRHDVKKRRLLPKLEARSPLAALLTPKTQRAPLRALQIGQASA